MSNYQKQDRGDDAGYAEYFAGMNQSMQQKVALTTAHFPPSGTVADMGSGSGKATFDLACLYSGLALVGVDINPKAVEISARTFAKPNLRYLAGDIVEPLFANESLDGILNSSVLHHVTSFNGFALAPVERLLDNQAAELKRGGVLIIRDFVIPRGPETVDLELLLDDATLFETFAKTWKSSHGNGVRYEERTASRKEVRRFRLLHRIAAEFVLRKDYRDHWGTELLEEYTYFSQADFERAFVARGLRIVTSVELHNPWIVERRFKGKIALFDLAGAPLPTPPTNYLIVGEKVGVGAGVRIEERSLKLLEKPRFLQLRFYKHVDSGLVYELAERPHRTLDVLPWFMQDGRAFVVCKHGFPRPIVNAASDAPDLIEQHGAGYITEPIAAIIHDGEASDVAVTRILRERAGAVVIRHISQAWQYFTSPGGINERVDAHLVEVEPWKHEQQVENYTTFSAAGSVRFLDATQVLRACHVGGMFDARLELNIYRLCRQQGLALGPWIGAELRFHEQAAPKRLPVPESRACFEPCPGVPKFLEICEGEFVEKNAAGEVLASARFEYVRPKLLSHNTLTLLPVINHAGVLYVGLEPRDLPAVQAFEGKSSFLTLPGMRLPRSVMALGEAETHALHVLNESHDLVCERPIALGGRYHPSTGLTPEVVYPYVVDVMTVGERCGLCFVPLAEALTLSLKDAHLLTALFRLSHATNG